MEGRDTGDSNNQGLDEERDNHGDSEEFTSG